MEPIWQSESQSEITDAGKLVTRAVVEHLARPAARPIVRRCGPMLAKDWNGDLDFPVFVQPKLNGLRCLAKSSGLFARGGDRFVSLPHLDEVLADFFLAHPHVVLDGELYCHGMPLRRIAGAARTSHPTADSLALSFNVFDLVAYIPFEERLDRLTELLEDCPPSVGIVPTDICHSQREMDAHYESCLRDGYEGQMIRDLDEPYVHGRSDGLLRRKPGQSGQR